MSFKRKSYEEIRDNIISQLTKGVVNERHTYSRGQARYSLETPSASRIVKINGYTDGQDTTYAEGRDYRLSDGDVEWLPKGARPDDDSVFEVNYSIGEARALTDANPGSVVRTIVEAVSREVDYMYAQLSHVYDAGFIETATGSSLDLVASILGVTRKAAEPAMGQVTFGRNTPPPDISIEQEAHLETGKDLYELKVTPVKAIVKVEGTLEGEAHEFQMGVDYTLHDDRLRWVQEAAKPDANSTFYVDYVGYETIKVPPGSAVSNYARRAEDTKTFETMEERVLEPTPDGKWEAQVPVRALEPGSRGNVFAGTLVVMPQPLVGVEYVINRGDILTGVDVESDEDLRERAKHALEVAGKASLASLDSAIKGVEGVSSVLIDDMPEGVPGIVKVVVQGGDEDEIKAVIEETRAAGIRVEFNRPMIVNLDIDITVVHDWGASPVKVSNQAEDRIRTYVSGLDIGDDVVYHRVVNTALQVPGVYDVDELSITAARHDAEQVTSSRENIVIGSDEMALPREVNVLLRERERRGT